MHARPFYLKTIVICKNYTQDQNSPHKMKTVEEQIKVYAKLNKQTKTQ